MESFCVKLIVKCCAPSIVFWCLDRYHALLFNASHPLDISFWLVKFVPWSIHDHCSPTNVINRTSSQYLYLSTLNNSFVRYFHTSKENTKFSQGNTRHWSGTQTKLDTNVMLIKLGIDENKFPSVKWNNDYINLSLIIMYTIHCYKICGLKGKSP